MSSLGWTDTNSSFSWLDLFSTFVACAAKSAPFFVGFCPGLKGAAERAPGGAFVLYLQK
jgi:hypothetical protein